jgi:hypothetical protein
MQVLLLPYLNPWITTMLETHAAFNRHAGFATVTLVVNIMP